MSEYTPMDSPFVSAEERQNRQEITRLMERHGFLHYPGEFWHYNKGDSLYQIQSRSGQPGRYGPVDWDPATNAVTPYADPRAPLSPLEVLDPLIQQAVQRLRG
jgi:hypothetical protein